MTHPERYAIVARRLRPLAAVLALMLAFACERAEERFHRAATSPDPGVRARTAQRLAKERPRNAVALLLGLLDDRDLRVRVEAAQALGQLRAAAAANPLSGLLRDPEPRARLAAVRALARLGRDAAAEALLGAVDDPGREVRRAARFALADLGIGRPEQVRRLAERTLHRYRRQLLSRLPAERIEACVQLGRSGRDAVAADVARLLRDPYADVSRAAAMALGALGTPGARQSLEQLAATSTEAAALARHGYLELLRQRTPEARAAATRFLASADLDLRVAALGALLIAPEGGPRPAAGELCRALDVAEPAQAVALALALAAAQVVCDGLPAGASEVGKRAAALTRPPPLTAADRAWVRQRVAGPEPVDRLVAALAAHSRDVELGTLLVGRASARYAELLRASERWLDEAAWRRLEADPAGAAGPADTRASPPATSPGGAGAPSDRLRRLLDRFPDRREGETVELLPPRLDEKEVTTLLGAVAPIPSAWPWLAELAGRAPVRVRTEALLALGRSPCGSVPCREAVQTALGHEDPEVRRAAARVLAQRPALLPERLAGLLGDPDLEIRRAAAWALSTARPATAFEALQAAFRRGREPHLVEAFARLGDRRAERLLSGLLREEQTGLRLGERLAVVEALEWLGSRDTALALAVELEHPEPGIRLAAARALGRLGDRRSASDLAICREDFYRVVREACQEASQAVQRR